MKTRQVVTVIVQKGDHLLFGRKPKDIGPYANTWHLLGGGVNKEESYEDAVRREVKEEAGIDIRIIRKLGTDEDTTTDKHGKPIHFYFHDYLAAYVSGEPKPSDDIEKLQWFPKDTLAQLELNSPSIKLFSRLGWL